MYDEASAERHFDSLQDLLRCSPTGRGSGEVVPRSAWPSPPRSPARSSGCTPVRGSRPGRGRALPRRRRARLAAGRRRDDLSEVGYDHRRAAVARAGRGIAEVRFRIETYHGEPLTDYVEEQTKDLHLYVVRDDLTVFRHLHPTMADDGTWTAPVYCPTPAATGSSPSSSPRTTAATATTSSSASRWTSRGRPGDPPPATPRGRSRSPSARGRPGRPDDADRARRRGPPGQPRHLPRLLRARHRLPHRHRRDAPPAPAHRPEVTEDGSELEFHTEIADPGDYRLFVQVRVDGFLHTVPVDLSASPRRQPRRTVVTGFSNRLSRSPTSTSQVPARGTRTSPR